MRTIYLPEGAAEALEGVGKAWKSPTYKVCDRVPVGSSWTDRCLVVRPANHLISGSHQFRQPMKSAQSKSGPVKRLYEVLTSWCRRRKKRESEDERSSPAGTSDEEVTVPSAARYDDDKMSDDGEERLGRGARRRRVQVSPPVSSLCAEYPN